MRFGAFGLACSAVVVFAIPALAHHSYSMFDRDKTVTLEGTVKEFQWTNPHAWVLVMVPDAEGRPQQWALELPAPGGLARNGWTPRTLTSGMNVTAVMHPLKDGQSGGSGLSVTLADGTVMNSMTNNVTSSGAAPAQ